MSSKKEQQLDYSNNSSPSSDTASTNSSSSSDRSGSNGVMKIDEIPTFDLNKIEFLEKLGEGILPYLRLIVGAFGKVRLCKIIKGGGFQGGSASKLKAVKSFVTSIHEGMGDDTSSNTADTQVCAIKILSKHAIIKAKQVDHVFNEMALQ